MDFPRQVKKGFHSFPNGAYSMHRLLESFFSYPGFQECSQKQRKDNVFTMNIKILDR